MTLTKTKLRSRMQYELLESLLRVNIYLNVNDMCCQSFTPSKEMLDKFNSICMYSIKNSKDDDNTVRQMVGVSDREGFKLPGKVISVKKKLYVTSETPGHV